MSTSPDPNSIAVRILTVSDSRELENDQSGDLIAQRFKDAGYPPVDRRIVREDPARLKQAFQRGIRDPSIDALVSTGGTGISHRDRTLDVLDDLLDRELPGFGELFRAKSVDEVGAYTVMSRATAGRAAKTIVFALPGSPNAVELAVEEIILEILPHTVHEATKHAPD